MARFEQDNDPGKADASPTKAFFVDIVTKDIQLDEAIQDLIDNCVDGAKRLRSDSNYKNLFVHLTVNAQEFKIVDNCGGIPLDVAQHYAFKFGRAKNFETTDSSVGQFGIGMKRAIFKMGNSFEITSVSEKTSFKIEQNIKDWLKDDINWDFPITELTEGNFEEADRGTALYLPDLARGVGDRFNQDTFKSALDGDLRIRQAAALANGLEITLNGKAIIPNVWTLKAGDGIEPMFRPFDDEIMGSELNTRLYAGVAESDRHSAGWYVFCNGRCILEADQEKTTGWSAVTEDGVRVPKYHNQFSRFRGFVFLDAKDAAILPWNTTKTDLDPESPAYLLLKDRLVEATRPVIDYLNALDKEFDLEPQDRELNRALDRARSQPLSALPANPSFLYKPPEVRGPAMSRITYMKPKTEMERLKEIFNVAKPTEVGTATFEYSYGTLVED